MVSLVCLHVQLECSVVDGVIFDNFSDDAAYVVFVGQLFEESGDSVQVSVLHVVVPTNARDSVFWLEHVCNRRVVNNDDVGHASAKTSEVFDEGIIVKSAMLSEQLVGTEAFGIELGDEWLGVFGQACREHHHFVVSAHPLKETTHSRTNQDINLANLSFDFDWQNDVSVFYWLELRVNESLVEVKHERLPSAVLFPLRPNKPFFLAFLLNHWLDLLPSCHGLRL